MPSISIKAIFVVHWLLFVWTQLNWGGSAAYEWANISVLVIAVWAIADRQSVDAILLFMVTLIWSCIVDIVCLSLFFPPSVASSSAKFSAGMAIVNLIFKPLSVILLFQMYRDRGGEYNINFGPNTPSYENLGGSDSHENSGSSAMLHAPTVTENKA